MLTPPMHQWSVFILVEGILFHSRSNPFLLILLFGTDKVLAIHMVEQKNN